MTSTFKIIIQFSKNLGKLTYNFYIYGNLPNARIRPRGASLANPDFIFLADLHC
jgi:hypothetical protein